MYKILIAFLLGVNCIGSSLAQDVQRPPRPLPPNNRPMLPPPGRDTATLPYKLTKDFPDFNIMLLDSVTIFKSSKIKPGKPVALMLFSPDCHHCQDFTEKLLKGMDSVKDVRFYMMSTSGYFPDIRKFYKDFNLKKYKNIKVVGWDNEFFYLTHFGCMRIPDVAIYDGDLKFVHLFEQNVTVKEIMEAAHGKR